MAVNLNDTELAIASKLFLELGKILEPAVKTPRTVKLEEALHKYAKHDAGCSQVRARRCRCDCGLREAQEMAQAYQ